jgi:Glycosyl transferase family 90
VHAGLIDAGISAVVQFGDDEVVREVKQSGLMRDPVPWQEWNRYKYQIDIDGNTNAWSGFFQRLLTGSPVLKIESPRGLVQWFYDELRPWHNYVPVAPDISDLVEKVNWLNRNDAVAEAIGHRGLALASRVSYAREMTRSVPVLSAAFRYFSGRTYAAGPYGRPLSASSDGSAG